MFSMMLASVPTADSEGFLAYGGIANGTSSAITGANMKTASKKPVEKRFITDPLDILPSVADTEANFRIRAFDIDQRCVPDQLPLRWRKADILRMGWMSVRCHKQTHA